MKIIKRILMAALLILAALFVIGILFGEQKQPEASAQTAATEKQPEQAATAPVGPHYDESMPKGGFFVRGEKEPYYVGIIGWAASYPDTGDKFPKAPWTVPTYTKDKQLFTKSGEIPHKTEVIVIEQLTETDRYTMTGFLKVKETATGAEHYIGVGSFSNRPYWNYPIERAAQNGRVVAVFRQKSDLYPVDKFDKVEKLKDGTKVIITGTTGLYGRGMVDYKKHPIKGIVYKRWREGFGAGELYFTAEDLQIEY